MGKGKRARSAVEEKMGETANNRKRKPPSGLGYVSWFFKTFLTQLGCLGSEDSLCGTSTDSCDHLLDSPTPPNYKGCSNVNSGYLNAGDRGFKSRGPGAGESLDPDDCDGEKERCTMSLNNCTMPCDTGIWASFNEKSRARGRRFKVYSGIYNGNSPKRGDKCVVKVFTDKPGTKTMCDCEKNKCKKAKELAKAYNSRRQNTKIRIASLHWAVIDEVSLLKKVFFSGHRKLTSGEPVVFEDDLTVDEERPGKTQKLTKYIDSLGRLSSCKAKDLEAFAHFSYHHSEGELVLCGLEGVHDSEGFVVKTPTVHSTGQDFGTGDLGDAGIRKFFDHHVCNEICRSWIKPDSQRDVERAEEEQQLDILEKCREPALRSEKPPLPRRDSQISQATERSSDYLEPSAPQIDLNEDFQPTGWMMRGQTDFRPPAAVTQMSVDEVSEPETKRNLNESPRTGATDDLMSNCRDSEYSSDVLSSLPSQDAGCVNNGGRRVRFSLSTGATSGIETATNITDTSGSHFPRPALKRQVSAPPVPLRCNSSYEDPMARFVIVQANPNSPNQTNRAIAYSMPANIVFGFPENPPSYFQSQIDYCRDWVEEHHSEMNGPLQPLTSMDTNGNPMTASLANPQYL